MSGISKTMYILYTPKADGRIVSGSGDGTLKVWNVNTGVREKTLEGHRNAVY
jgi:WD40 repeat protein